ncbi:amphoterin-induced protein 3-like [Cynoglossus semilaevis]|uniref:amphoterin-induced protein 3-like n=1 Tax=Cynoglossus semilaevis TaxID=244447 RepID=UPI0004967F22|nr:amphoterin-induced protein 3-like [Cynoglossus semilaevis]
MTSDLHCSVLPFLLLPLLPPLPLVHADSCPAVCLCVSDTVSCSSRGLTRLPVNLPPVSVTLDLGYNRLWSLGPGGFTLMPRLETLQLGHNQLRALGPGVFFNTSGLRHLDLSSNRLQVVEKHYFQELWRLEELLLFNNRITQVEGGALGGLPWLKKAYFSLNLLTHFPFFSIKEQSHPSLTTLDLSSNRLGRLPWEQVDVLPTALQRGLYLHNNSLVCDCSLYRTFHRWEVRGYDSVKDFEEELTCSIFGNRRASVRFLLHGRFFHNCSVERGVSGPVSVLLPSVVVPHGDRVRLDCQTSLSGRSSSHLWFTWLSPSRGALTPSSVRGSVLRLSPDGTLDIPAVRLEDSGTYVCTAVDHRLALNATRRVEVTVLPPAGESFSTGYTTLVGCVVTVGLILIYLYLTPCHCGHPGAAAAPAPTCDPEGTAPDKTAHRGHGGHGGHGGQCSQED